MRVASPQPHSHPRLMTSVEVAAVFKVDPKTVARWARAGKITSLTTLGGNRRYRVSDVEEALAASLIKRNPEA